MQSGNRGDSGKQPGGKSSMRMFRARCNGLQSLGKSRFERPAVRLSRGKGNTRMLYIYYRLMTLKMNHLRASGAWRVNFNQPRFDDVFLEGMYGIAN